MRRVTPLLTAAALGLGAAPAIAAPAAAPLGAAAAATIDPVARAASCEALAGGTVNDVDAIPFKQIPEAGSLEQWPAAPAALRLPAQVFLRTARDSFNQRYAFATRDGNLYVAPRAGGGAGWRELPLPDCFAGQVESISGDDDELVAIAAGRRVFTMDNALKGPDLFNWSRRWGPPMWAGPGRTLPQGALAWSWSVLSPAEDVTFPDPAGNAHKVGERKVSHIWALRSGGRRITFIDPWLPEDDSYEMCAPQNGRFRSVNVSASGSTVFVVGSRGDLFTRFYDFDASGHDGAFFTYAWGPQRRRAAGQPEAAIELPALPWVHQPKVPGTITSAISVEKRGVGGIHRTLRVEGLDRRGRTGYWEKDVVAAKASAWRFHRTGQPLQGRRLANPQRDTSRTGLAPAVGVRYAGRADGLDLAVSGFDIHCSPATLKVTGGDGRAVALRLHSVDGLRQERRSAFLDGAPRELYGAIEVPPAVLARLNRQPADVRAFVRDALRGRRFTPVTLRASTRALDLAELKWELTR